MKLKGCQRNVILLRGIDSEVFEEAYFVLKRDMQSEKCLSNDDMVLEARRIVAANSFPTRRVRRLKPSQAIFFAAGALSAAGATAILGAFGLFS